MPELPAHSPLIAGDLVCNTCGETMERKVVMNRQGVDHIQYSCSNKEKGCNYFVEAKMFSNLQPMGMRKLSV